MSSATNPLVHEKASESHRESMGPLKKCYVQLKSIQVFPEIVNQMPLAHFLAGSIYMSLKNRIRDTFKKNKNSQQY